MGQPALSARRSIRCASRELAVPYLHRGRRSHDAADERRSSFWRRAMAMATASVDRLNQMPSRLAFLFDFDVSKRALDDARSSRQEVGTRRGARR